MSAVRVPQGQPWTLPATDVSLRINKTIINNTHNTNYVNKSKGSQR